MSTAGHRSLVGSSKFHGSVPLGSSGYLRRAECRLSTSLGVDQRFAYQFGAAIPAPWDPNVHPFSELCARTIATSASRLVELCR
ncbi:jg15291 [Pararge aegeria aegeria]|uniref:Jg15291 protein n=1 Tax=Pararge aegeria aegeria TaxID=348720 RepID=A0A8S4R6K3_9NEOP|nr:jg15291 [Pararge aegeria aegeria]